MPLSLNGFMIGWRTRWSVNASWTFDAPDPHIHGLAEQFLKFEYIPAWFYDVLADDLRCNERQDTKVRRSDIPSRINKASDQGSARF